MTERVQMSDFVVRTLMARVSGEVVARAYRGRAQTQAFWQDVWRLIVLREKAMQAAAKQPS